MGNQENIVDQVIISGKLKEITMNDKREKAIIECLCDLGNSLDLSKPGQYLLYGSEFNDHLEIIRHGMMIGTMHVTLDYNRSGWRTDTPLDGIIYRITVQ